MPSVAPAARDARAWGSGVWSHAWAMQGDLLFLKTEKKKKAGQNQVEVVQSSFSQLSVDALLLTFSLRREAGV